MKTSCVLLSVFIFLTINFAQGQSCNNWLQVPSQPSFVRVGDLDITGNQLTIEATINRTSAWSGSDVFQGDVVSKHEDQTDCNYLLRPSSAEITTTNGYFKTPVICPIQLNKTYHLAMVYDGSSLKFYRNGFLMSQVPATGNLVQNDWQTQVGLYFHQVTQENFIGYINEVRIWNVARTQTQIQAYMNQSLPSPQTTLGLLAYYTFDDLKNKQGNPLWDGVLGGSASINQTNPNCSFLADSCEITKQVSVIPSFTAPDTVCVNTPVTITNTSTGASSYYWNFCSANLNKTPSGANIGNLGGQLTTPCFMDYGYENGNYYGFVISNNPPSLVRLDFGNSLLNTPTAINLGNFGGILPYGAQGIQVVQEGGNWYAIITGGDSLAVRSSTSRILKVSFGSTLTNTSPTITNWGNIGGMAYPHDLFVFKDAGIWYGFTVNYQNGTVTRFNFGSDFSSTPNGTNLGNLGNLNEPSGICPIKDNGIWRVFVSNFGSHTLSRIDFGNSLLNNPTSAVNLGNVGGLFHSPRDMYIFNYCDQSVGFLVNEGTNDLVRLNFSNLSSTPTATSLGNVAGFASPHSISKLFRAGPDLFGFVANSYVNTISRVQFSGCTNASIPNSTAQNPPPIIYDSAGVYNINLSVDDTLPTQAAFCKQVVVVALPPHLPLKTIAICGGASVKIGSATHPATYLWSTGATTDSIVVVTPGIYWVETSNHGCSSRDSFMINSSGGPPMDFSYQQDICFPKTVQFFTNLANLKSLQWSYGDGQTGFGNQAPIINYSDYGSYPIQLKVQYNNGCMDSLTKSITIDNVYADNLIANNDSTICLGDSVLLQTSSSAADYCWKSSTSITPNSLNGYVKPKTGATYILNSEVVGSNLVVNGDFSLGNTGFASDYTYSALNTTEGQYFVGNNALSWNPYVVNCGDHSSGNGNMLLLNGFPSANKKVWSQNITVQPNTDYQFSVWGASLSSQNPAGLHLFIDNADLGNNLQLSSTTCQWKNFSVRWNSGSATSVNLSIGDTSTIIDGNDFAIDDIFFGQVATKTDSVTINVSGLCDSVKITGADKICSSSDTLTYSIYKSPNCTQQYSLLVDNSFATIVSQSATDVKLVFKQNGSTTIRAAYANNCKMVVDSLPLTIQFSPVSINFGPDVITCRDTSFILHAGAGFTSYLWQDASTDSSLSVSDAGMYTVTAQNLCGVQFHDSLQFIKTAVIPFSVQPLSVEICKGDSVQFTAKGGSVYSWSPAASFNNASSSTPKAVINNSQSISVSISDPVCLRDTSITIPVNALPAALISVAKSNDVSCGNDSAILIANGGVSYTWSPNLYITRNRGSQITVKPFQNTTYYVQGVDATGCAGQDSVTVYFSKTGDQKLYMPTAFTPNGDGLNDIFKPTFIGPSAKYDFRIFNRWGQLVFRSTRPGEGWDGNYRGVPQKNDVYVFSITAEGGCNGNFEQKGTFALIR